MNKDLEPRISRLQLHIPHDDATLIARAAIFTKKTPSEFIIAAAMERAKRVEAEVTMRVLPLTLIIAAAACFAVVVLTHVAEAFEMFPAMGWGMPNSAGHYLDLTSAVLGCVLLALGAGAYAFRLLRRPPR